MISALGWAAVHALWQGAIVCAVWYWLAHRSSARVRYAAGGAALVLLTLLFLATALAFAHAGGLQPRVHDALHSVGGATWAGAASIAQRLGWGAAVPAAVERLGWVWLLGAGLLVVRHLAGWRIAHRRYAGSAELARGEWSEAAARAARRLRLARLPLVLESPTIDSPAVLGVLAPVVLLPSNGMDRLTPAQRDGVIAHEVVHVRRRDGLANLLQCLVEALFFFHPIVRRLSRRVREDREKLCDRAAVELCGDPRTYASGLLLLEESRHRTGHFALAARSGELLGRVRDLLEPEPVASRRAPIAALLGTLALLVAGACLTLPPSLDASVASWAPERYTVAAVDPVGRFTLVVQRGRAVAASVGGVAVPRSALVHARDSVIVIPPDGGPRLALHVEPRGGIRWTPRPIPER